MFTFLPYLHLYHPLSNLQIISIPLHRRITLYNQDSHSYHLHQHIVVVRNPCETSDRFVHLLKSLKKFIQMSKNRAPWETLSYFPIKILINLHQAWQGRTSGSAVATRKIYHPLPRMERPRNLGVNIFKDWQLANPLAMRVAEQVPITTIQSFLLNPGGMHHLLSNSQLPTAIERQLPLATFVPLVPPSRPRNLLLTLIVLVLWPHFQRQVQDFLIMPLDGLSCLRRCNQVIYLDQIPPTQHQEYSLPHVQMTSPYPRLTEISSRRSRAWRKK